jgi:hypothetical protein
LLCLPWTFSDGENLQLLVEEVERGVYVVSDRGLAADALSMQGVDLDATSVRKSWNAVRESIDAPPPMADRSEAFSLAAMASRDGLGAAMTAVAESMLRAEGLVFLRPGRHARTFAERVVQRAGMHRSLTIVPRAMIPGRHGGKRQVTLRVDNHNRTYVQAVSRSGNEAYDRAKSVFSDAEKDAGARVSIVADTAELEGWQLKGLREVGEVVAEREQDGFFASLAA